jgi:putative nucleotidyltransferase with HDIG domain
MLRHPQTRSLAGHFGHATTPDCRQQIIEALARTMNARDAATYEHAERVRGYALALAQAVPTCDVHTTDALDHAALLHDIGKLAIPDWLLQKPGPLTPQEYEQVKQHATIGADMLAAIGYPGPLALIVRHHHERWDGTGYPDGLGGEAIPLGARLLAVADCYDAVRSDRPYHRAVSHGRAIKMLRERAGNAFDPAIVDAFAPLVDRLLACRESYVSPRFPTLLRAGWLPEVRAAW